MKIRTKMLLSILAAAVVVFGAMMWISFSTGKRALTGEIQNRARLMLEAYSGNLADGINTLEDLAQSLAVAVETLDPSSEEGLKNLIKKSIQLEPLVYGSTIAFEPNAFPGRAGLFAPYFHKAGDRVIEVDLATATYNYPDKGWYTVPMETKKGYWTDPYMDIGGGNVAMVTYAHPIIRENSARGVATVDIALDELTREIEKVKIGETGFAFLLSRRGTFLTMKTEGWKLGRTFLEVAEELRSDDLKNLSIRMMTGETGFVMLKNPLSGKDAWFAFGPIAGAGWSLCFVFPEAEMMDEIKSLNIRMAAIAIAGLAILGLLIFAVANQISNPIVRLADEAHRFASGDFTFTAPVRAGNDEVGVLTRVFAEMAEALSGMIEKLRSEKELFSASFDQMSDGLVILDTDFTPIKFNLTAEKLLALPSAGSIVDHILSRFDCSPEITRISDFSKGPPAFELTRRASDTAGALHLVMIATPIRSRSGELINMVLAIRDVTELKAEELSKRDFLSTISHKLRTPVAVLQSSIFLIKDRMLGELNEKQQKHAGMMSDQIGKLASLIEELIGFVTLEGQALSATKEHIELAPFISGIADECAKLHPDKNTKIAVEVSPDASKIEFNRGYLRLIICELLQNATKFNASTTPEVTFRCRREGGQIYISATDNGVGIPPELHNRIFEKFFQSERYFTGNVEGVGLGLTLIKKIVDFAGGTIDVKSEPGKGSTFTIRLPSA